MLSTVIDHKFEPRSSSIWQRLCAEAERIAQNEPMMNDFINDAILQHHSFEQALVARLAVRLAGEGVGTEKLLAAFEKAITGDSEIAPSAEADLLAVLERDPACYRLIEPFLYFKGWHALQAHRIAHFYWKAGQKDFAYFIQSRVSAVTTVDIHPAARIGKAIMIDHAHDVVIGEACVMEDNISLMQGVTLGGNGKEKGDRHPKIRQGVLVGAGAKILGNIEIGLCSRVAAGSVVLHSVPPHTTVAGIPAKVVGASGSSEPARLMNHQIEADEG